MIAIFTLIIGVLTGLCLGAWATRQRTTRNKDRAWNEAGRYIVQNNPFNSPPRQAFTVRDVRDAGARADRNPEDFA
jgi:hypothetical protein